MFSDRFGVGFLIDRFSKKKWSPDDVRRQVGNYLSAHITHAQDSIVRSSAASGGTTTALLIEALDRGVIDGAAVCVTRMEGGAVRARFVIATDAEGILAARGSKYVSTDFLREVVPLIRRFKGRLAVVGLPCDISALSRWTKKFPDLESKVALTIALLCGHNSREGLVDEVTRRIELREQSKIVDYKFRVGHWRGKIEATLQNGSVRHYSTSRFNDFQNLYFFCERKCIACHDHYGYAADISIGDIWLFRFRSDPIKKSGVIVRSQLGSAVLSMGMDSGRIVVEDVPIEFLMDGQSRIGPNHYNVSARVKAARLFGIRFNDPLNQPVPLIQYCNAVLTILNMRLSETHWGRKLIFGVPHIVIKVYLYFKKGLETLK